MGMIKIIMRKHIIVLKDYNTEDFFTGRSQLLHYLFAKTIRNSFLYSKPSAYMTEKTDTRADSYVPISTSVFSMIKYCRAGLKKIHDLMWGKTSSAVTAMMTGVLEGGTSRYSSFVTLERSFLELVPFQWAICVEMVHIFRGTIPPLLVLLERALLFPYFHN